MSSEERPEIWQMPGCNQTISSDMSSGVIALYFLVSIITLTHEQVPTKPGSNSGTAGWRRFLSRQSGFVVSFIQQYSGTNIQC